MRRIVCRWIDGVSVCKEEHHNKKISRQKVVTLADRIAKLRKPGEKGLGDTVARIFSTFGGNKFKWISKQLGINCGCDDRQADLNAWFPYPDEAEL
jgi:hypothetical protein